MAQTSGPSKDGAEEGGDVPAAGPEKAAAAAGADAEASAFEEWRVADEEWQRRAAAGEDPGPRTPPPLPPPPDPQAAGNTDAGAAPQSKASKWWSRGEDAAMCASCGCAFSDLCDTNLRVLLLVLVSSASAAGSTTVEVPTEFRDDSRFHWATRGSLSALRWYKRRISAHTPNVCTQEVSCSAYAARSVRELGAVRATPLVIRRLRLCAAAARTRRAEVDRVASLSSTRPRVGAVT